MDEKNMLNAMLKADEKTGGISFKTEATGSSLSNNAQALYSGPFDSSYYFREIVPNYYPRYWPNFVEVKENKFEKAFKIVSLLMEKNIIKGLTLKRFIGLVNEVTELV